MTDEERMMNKEMKRLQSQEKEKEKGGEVKNYLKNISSNVPSNILPSQIDSMDNSSDLEGFKKTAATISVPNSNVSVSERSVEAVACHTAPIKFGFSMLKKK